MHNAKYFAERPIANMAKLPSSLNLPSFSATRGVLRPAQERSFPSCCPITCPKWIFCGKTSWTTCSDSWRRQRRPSKHMVQQSYAVPSPPLILDCLEPHVLRISLSISMRARRSSVTTDLVHAGVPAPMRCRRQSYFLPNSLSYSWQLLISVLLEGAYFTTSRVVIGCSDRIVLP